MSQDLSILYPFPFWTSSLEKYTHTHPLERWRRVTLSNQSTVWVSEFGACIFNNTLLPLQTSQRLYYINRLRITPAKLTALAFGILPEDLRPDEMVLVTLKDKSKPVTIDNLFITIYSTTTGFFDPPERNGSTGILFRPGYSLYPDGALFSLHKAKRTQPSRVSGVLSGGRNTFRPVGEKTPYYIDILVLIYHGDLQHLTYEDVHKDYTIHHLNGDLSDDSVSNLSYKKDILLLKTQKQNELHTKILSILEDRHAILVTPIEQILNTKSKFTYNCLCGQKTTFYSNLVKTDGCKDCKRRIIDQVTNDNPLEYKPFTEDKIKYHRFDRGWVSERGDILNNLKEPVTVHPSTRDFIINSLHYNAKDILVQAFKLPNYKKLDNKTYFVFQIQQGEDYGITNLVVQTFTSHHRIVHQKRRELQEQCLLEDDTYNGVSSTSAASEEEIKEVQSLSHPSFEGYTFYENGIIRSARGNYLRGSLNKKDGNLVVCINKKKYGIYRLICFVFHPLEGYNEYDDYREWYVEHIDQNKQNNHQSNLRWISNSEFQRLRVERGDHHDARPISVYQVDEKGQKGERLFQYKTLNDATKGEHISLYMMYRIAVSEKVHNGLIYSFE